MKALGWIVVGIVSIVTLVVGICVANYHGFPHPGFADDVFYHTVMGHVGFGVALVGGAACVMTIATFLYWNVAP